MRYRAVMRADGQRQTSGYRRTVEREKTQVPRKANESRIREVKMNQTRPLTLNPIEMSAQNCVHKIGLRDFELVGRSFNEFFVVVCNNELLIFIGEGPGAHIAVQRTPPARVALDIVALLAQWLPIIEIIRTIARTRDFMVRTQLHVGLLSPTGCAFVTVLFSELLPISVTELRSRLTFLAYFEALQLVPGAFFHNRGEALLSLKLPHSAENVSVRFFATASAIGIYECAHIVFCQDRSRNSVSCRPKSPQDNRVVELVYGSRRNKTSLRIVKPFLPASFRFARRDSGSDMKTLACARLSHFAVRY
jgi:hypothetical protein